MRLESKKYLFDVKQAADLLAEFTQAKSFGIVKVSGTLFLSRWTESTMGSVTSENDCDLSPTPLIS